MSTVNSNIRVKSPPTISLKFTDKLSSIGLQTSEKYPQGRAPHTPSEQVTLQTWNFVQLKCHSIFFHVHTVKIYTLQNMGQHVNSIAKLLKIVFVDLLFQNFGIFFFGRTSVFEYNSSFKTIPIWLLKKDLLLPFKLFHLLHFCKNF